MTAFFACVYGALFIEQLYAFFGIMRPKRHLFIILVLISTGSIAVGYLFRLIWAAAYSQNGRS